MNTSRVLTSGFMAWLASEKESDLGFEGAQTQNDGLDACPRQLVLALQIIAFGEQAGLLLFQAQVLGMQGTQVRQQGVDLAIQRLVILFEHVRFAVK